MRSHQTNGAICTFINAPQLPPAAAGTELMTELISLCRSSGWEKEGVTEVELRSQRERAAGETIAIARLT